MHKAFQLLTYLGMPGLLFAASTVNAQQVPDRSPQDVLTFVVKLKDNDEYVRRSALTALGRIGPEAKEAIPAITIALQDNNRLVRIYAASALKKVDAANP